MNDKKTAEGAPQPLIDLPRLSRREFQALLREELPAILRELHLTGKAP